MSLYQHRDGELRLYSGVTTPCSLTSTARVYATLLFVDAGMSAPIARTKPVETLVMDRGVYTNNAEYREGMDEEKLEPLPISFTFSLVDDVTTQYFVRMIEGVSPLTVNGMTIRSSKGESAIDGVSTPQFADTGKMAFDVEVLWDGGTDMGFRWREVYFPGGQQTVSEGVDAVQLNVNGLVYGSVTRITSFASGSTIYSGYSI